ncbi:hypothetical protein [Paenibacillus tepidiphilus]|uniref:hypothetical protein n=1 Tax=Paenibacillus tepidiphilus TaxID=2608683 RepID=UPI00123B2977|nr:hypothetical protein [Paenibacillus tepidiphilus]
MNLFVMRSLLGEEAAGEFLRDHYVTPGLSGLGDLEQATREAIRQRLEAEAGCSAEELDEMLEGLHMFVNLMQDGDYVLIADAEWAYLGDLGDYFYAGRGEDDSGERSHRRGVTWLRSLPRAEVNPQVTELLDSPRWLTRYEGKLPAARVELWIAGAIAGAAEEPEGIARPKVDDETISAALEVLKEALASADPERRERAAAAILQYARS